MMATTAPKLKNKRLSGNDRDALTRLAVKLVDVSEDRAELDTAYAVAASAVRAAVEEQFPPKDMLILAKYKAAVNDACIRVSRGNYHVDQFCFRAEDTAPMRPSHGGCGSRAYGLTPAATDALDAFQIAEKARNERMKKRVADYKSLINSMPSFNDVAAVWPEAEELRTSIVGSATAVLILSNDVIERIQSDVALRQAA